MADSKKILKRTCNGNVEYYCGCTRAYEDQIIDYMYFTEKREKAEKLDKQQLDEVLDAVKGMTSCKWEVEEINEQ